MEGESEGGKERGNLSEASGTVGNHLGVTPSNVELRNYVISRQNFIKSSYVIT